jgi:cell wall-associated NlpC family hydrolase
VISGVPEAWENFMLATHNSQLATLLPWQAALDRVLRSWAGTPWRAGQCCKGSHGGVDCFFFLVGVLDELHGITAPRPPRLPQDTSINNRPLATAALKRGLARYPCTTLSEEAILQPGDVAIVRKPSVHPDTLQHGMIVGADRQLWHSCTQGVCFTSMAGWVRREAYRLTDREKWK